MQPVVKGADPVATEPVELPVVIVVIEPELTEVPDDIELELSVALFGALGSSRGR